MKDRINGWIIRLGLWLARTGGWDETPIVAPYEQQIQRLLEQAKHDASSRDRVIDDLSLTLAEREQAIQEREGKLKGLSEAAVQREASLSTVIHDMQRTIQDLQSRMATAATVSKPVFDRAGQLSRDADTTLSGGEAKRHQVYAKLIKDFPIVNKRELALAIELALFHSPKEG